MCKAPQQQECSKLWAQPPSRVGCDFCLHPQEGCSPHWGMNALLRADPWAWSQQYNSWPSPLGRIEPLPPLPERPNSLQKAVDSWAPLQGRQHGFRLPGPCPVSARYFVRDLGSYMPRVYF